MKIPLPFLTLAFVWNISVSRTVALDESCLPRPFLITRNHRRLKGFTFNTIHSASQVSCALQCQRNPRCVSSNFRKVSSIDETEGICELNAKKVLLPAEEKELEYYEKTVYTQFYDMKVRQIQFIFLGKNENNVKCVCSQYKEDEFTCVIFSFKIIVGIKCLNV